MSGPGGLISSKLLHYLRQMAKPVVQQRDSAGYRGAITFRGRFRD